MNTPNIEKFYEQINKSILLTKAYTEINELEFIIKSCRLKPYNLIIDKEKYKLQLYKKWFDEFGNSLSIIKKNRLKIIYNDLSVDRAICTDLYFGLSMEKIVKFSKIVHIIAGYNEDTNDHYFLITFVGIDNYLRSYMYDYSQWQKVSPLMLGIKRLKNIFNHLDIKYFHELSNKENFMTPCASSVEWISCLLTPPQEFVKILKKKHDADFSFLIQE